MGRSKGREIYPLEASRRGTRCVERSYDVAYNIRLVGWRNREAVTFELERSIQMRGIY